MEEAAETTTEETGIRTWRLQQDQFLDHVVGGRCGNAFTAPDLGQGAPQQLYIPVFDSLDSTDIEQGPN